MILSTGFLTFLPFKSSRDLATKSLFAFGFRFGSVVRTDVADVITACADDVITLASASDAEDVVVVSLEFVSFHVFKIPRPRKNARDFFYFYFFYFSELARLGTALA